MPQLALMLALKLYLKLMAIEIHMKWVPKQENSGSKPENDDDGWLSGERVCIYIVKHFLAESLKGI